MRLPKRNIGLWARELINECRVSQQSRRSLADYWRNLYYTGTINNMVPSKHNRCFTLVDTLSSYLFSPADVKFSIEFEADESEEWSDCAQVAQRHLNREFNRRRCGITFGAGVDLGLIDGCSFAKTVWGRSGYEPYLIRQQFMGVLREDIEDLDRQEAFIHTYYVTESQFRRLLWNHPRKKEFMARVENMFDARAAGEIAPQYLHEIIIGGSQPLNRIPPSGSSMGSVAILATPSPMLAPEVGNRLIRIDDLWVVNDEQNDWTTIRYIDPEIVIEGEDIHRNLSDVPHEQPFVKICPNEVPGYMWGRSELANVVELQMLMNARIDNVDTIFRLQARPPKAFVGFQSIDENKARALLAPDGWLSEPTMGANVKTLAPSMPPNALEYIKLLDSFFDDAAGLTPIMSGHGEAGVRAGVHASTLLKTGSPRLRDRALLVEGQCATYGDLWFKMSQAKNADVFSVKKKGGGGVAGVLTGIFGGPKDKEFLLSQLPQDAQVSVDSHTSSPAFTDANTNLVFSLARAGAVDGRSLIELTHPPKEDVLVDRYEQRQAAEAALVQQHPELLTKGKSRK